MTVENWQRVKDLLDQAIEMGPEQRTRFIDEACGSDAGLRAEVESLLSVGDGMSADFLQSPLSGEFGREMTGIESAGALAAGQIFADRFQLIRRLGEGGMGQVWLAEQTSPVRRQVALKLIRAGMYDEAVVQRFQSERQSLAIMDHPAIAKVFDAGATPQGQPYLVMEYVPGLPITEYCDQHKLNVRDRLDLFIQACEGVQHAHQKAIIHRDLKPANILIVQVDGKPVPRIIDFGLAKATVRAAEPAEQTMLTRFGLFIGTPGYMSPEQVDPNIHDIDTRTDVYSLGVILYVLLAGLQPFETKGRRRPPLDEWLRQLREEEPPSPSAKVNTERETLNASAEARSTEPHQLASLLRGDLDWITLKALERDRERRYGTPSELAADLRRYLSDEPVIARPASAGYQIRKFVRRHRIAASFVGMVTILSIAAFTAAFLAVRQRIEAEHQRGEAQVQTAKALQAQARLLTQAAAQRLKDGDIARAQSIILEVLTNPIFAQARASTAISVFQEIRAADLQLAVLFGHGASIYVAAYSPDGTRIATASGDKTTRLWDAHSGAQLAVLSGHGGRVNSAAYSPDGTRIVTGSDDETARIWDARTGAQLAVLSGHRGRVNSAAYSPDGAHLVTASDDETARIWDARTGAQLAVLSSHDGHVNSAAYSPDGAHLVTASDDKTARIWDARTGAQFAVLTGHGKQVSTAVYSPDGTRIVTASDDKTARVWDARTGAQLALLSGHGDRVNFAAYSPDGMHIITASADRTARIWLASTGVQLRIISGHDQFVYAAAYSPDNTRIVTASLDRTARIWEAQTGGELAELSGHRDRVLSAAYSPDGNNLVTASADKTARIWDSTTGAPRAVLVGHGDYVFSAAYSPDGRNVITASLDKTARIWDANTGAQLAVLIGHSGSVYHAAYSPDGSHIVTASEDKTARIWDARTHEQLSVLAGHSGFVIFVAYSPDGSRIASASLDHTVRIWNANTGAQLAVLIGHSGSVYHAAYSPDGSHIVTASADKTARIWDARTHEQLAVLSGHRDDVRSAAYSPDGARILTASADKTARIWDARTLEQLAVLSGHGDRVRSAEYSVDGTRLVTASDDYTARIWTAHVPADVASQIQWSAAAETDPLPDVERIELGLPPDSHVRSWSPRGSRCDQAAAAIYDPDRQAPGVVPEEFAADIADSACSAKTDQPDDSARNEYQRGRTLFVKGDAAGAKHELEAAVTGGYRAARIDLADLLLSVPTEILDSRRAESLYQQAWRDGVLIAAFKLGQLYEHRLRAEANSGKVTDASNAWAWYQKGADAGEPHALAHFAERDERNALGLTDASKRNEQLFDAFRLYAAAADRAHAEDWPDDAWRQWRYRRASLARILAEAGMMQQVADAYGTVLRR